MTSYGLCLALVLAVQTCAVHGQEDSAKGSITVVIDDSSSVPYNMQLLKEAVNVVLDKVLRPNASPIEDLVLVTFNSSDAKVETITEDQNKFVNALSAIKTYVGGDCAEYSLKGIELGLEASAPRSYLYVFTDAVAEDSARFEQIKHIAQEKQSQINFILTGACCSGDDDDFQVYYKLAAATNGHVFSVMKDTVYDMLAYVEKTISSRPGKEQVQVKTSQVQNPAPPAMMWRYFPTAESD